MRILNEGLREVGFGVNHILGKVQKRENISCRRGMTDSLK